jgi:hypothetical protein
MPHPLDGPFLRLNRADRHLTEADKLVRAWEDATVKKIVRKPDGQHRFNRFADVDPVLSVVIGDATHNLRAALDYLIYELSLWDSHGCIEDGTQFPIEGSKGDDPVVAKARFRGRRESYLKGLNDRHAAIIEGLQPYNGIEWTETLRSISNPDKHRHLHAPTTAGRQVQVTIRINPDGRFVEELFDSRSVDLITRRFDVELDGQFAIAITLPNRGEVAIAPALRRIQAEVCRVLEAFKPEF